jgi:deoxyadenosine/deoxycytidine kinase
MTYIVIEGVIGVGKTALTKLMGERLGMPTLFEQFEENPFLISFTLSIGFGKIVSGYHSLQSCA